MDKLVKREEWYQSLIDDCKSIITEAIFISRWALVEGYHNLGKRIREDENWEKYSKGAYSSLTDLSKNIEIGERDIYRSLQFYDKYPDLSQVPEGNNITWNKIITKYLPAHKKEFESPPIPKGKYSVFYADPPWPVDSMILEKWKSPLADKYPTMTIEEINNLGLKLSEHIADNCSLFLWTTHTYLKEAFDVIEAWGFKYHCCITWDKGSGWSLCGFHRRTEFCLYAYKGKINITQTGKYIPTLISESKREHSEKPEIMYKLIEGHTPSPRLELFARKKRDGWIPWGNQI